MRLVWVRAAWEDYTHWQVTLPTFGGSRLCPGVDLDDRDTLAALLDERTRIDQRGWKGRV